MPIREVLSLILSRAKTLTTRAFVYCCAALLTSPFRRSVCTDFAGRGDLRSCALHRRLCTRGVEGRSSFWGACLRDCSLFIYDHFPVTHLHCLSSTLHQLLNGYIEQARLSMSGNGAFGSYGTGPASGYFLMNFLVHCVFSVVSITCFMLVATNTNVFVSVHAIVYVMFYSIFRIKLNRKMPLIPSF